MSPSKLAHRNFLEVDGRYEIRRAALCLDRPWLTRLFPGRIANEFAGPMESQFGYDLCRALINSIGSKCFHL